MATLSQARTLGGIGSIIIFIPFVSLIGYILLIVAVKDISDDLQDKTIFNNIVIAAVAGIVGALAAAGGVVLGVLSSGFRFGLAGVGGLLGGLLVAWVFLIVSAVFLRRAYDTMANRLGVGTFRTAATLYLIGAALTIVFVGLFLLFIAEIVQAIAFFSIPDQPSGGPTGQGPAASPAPVAQAQVLDGSSKFCKSCGTKISSTATFCYACGAKQ